MHTAIIVDDEPLARERIRTLLGARADVSIIAECGDGISAINAIRAHRPDILFLDIQMPGIDGFGVLAHLTAREIPATIFVTAFDAHAIRAFDVGAADYVLKPIVADRFYTAVDRALSRLDAGASPARGIKAVMEQSDEQTAWLDRFAVERRGKLTLIPAREVCWLEADGNYVRVHTSDESWLLRGSLGVIATRLDPSEFTRIHRSTIVAIREVASVISGTHGDADVFLRNGVKLRAARVRARTLKHKLRPL